MLRHLQLREDEKRRLESQVLQDRADFTSQAKLLSQHFTLSHHRNTALQVANEALQVGVCVWGGSHLVFSIMGSQCHYEYGYVGRLLLAISRCFCKT